MKKSLFPLLILILGACSSAVNFTVSEAESSPEGVASPYMISQISRPGAIAFFMVEKPTLDQGVQQMLMEELHRRKYRIIVPLAAGENLIYQQKSDSRETRLRQFTTIQQHLKNESILDSTSEVLLLGLKEQAYLLPELNHLLPQARYISINAGPFSYLHEIRYLEITGDSVLNHSEVQELQLAGRELLSLPEQLQRENPHDVMLGYNTNQDWLSYYRYQSGRDFFREGLRGYYLISRHYPLISEYTRAYLKLLPTMNPANDINIIDMPGNADYRDAEEVEILREHFRNLLNSLR